MNNAILAPNELSEEAATSSAEFSHRNKEKTEEKEATGTSVCGVEQMKRCASELAAYKNINGFITWPMHSVT